VIVKDKHVSIAPAFPTDFKESPRQRRRCQRVVDQHEVGAGFAETIECLGRRVDDGADAARFLLLEEGRGDLSSGTGAKSSSKE
jgi:hypothetical protein